MYQSYKVEGGSYYSSQNYWMKEQQEREWKREQERERERYRLEQEHKRREQEREQKRMEERQEKRKLDYQKLISILEEIDTVETIDLHYTWIGNKGIIILADALKVNSSITNINLSDTEMYHQGLLAIVDVLKINITTINLSGNKISKKGAIILADALKVNSSIENINLANTGIYHEGLLAIIDVLRINTRITTIDFSRNRISEECAIELAEAFKVNQTLLKILLEATYIEKQGIIELVSSFETSSSLLTLTFIGNFHKSLEEKEVTMVRLFTKNIENQNIELYSEKRALDLQKIILLPIELCSIITQYEGLPTGYTLPSDIEKFSVINNLKEISYDWSKNFETNLIGIIEENEHELNYGNDNSWWYSIKYITLGLTILTGLYIIYNNFFNNNCSLEIDPNDQLLIGDLMPIHEDL